MEPLGHETEYQKVYAYRYYCIEYDGCEKSEHPHYAPVRLFAVLVYGIFLRDYCFHHVPFLLELLDNLEIRVTTIYENACLNIVISFLGIVVHVFKSLFCGVVVADVVFHLSRITLKGALDYSGKCETYCPVRLGFLRQYRWRHGLKTLYQTVITCHLTVCLGDKLAEGHLLVLKLLVLFSSLMAGIGKVEKIILIL